MRKSLKLINFLFTWLLKVKVNTQFLQKNIIVIYIDGSAFFFYLLGVSTRKRVFTDFYR